MDRSDPAYKGQASYNRFMLTIYDAWVLRFMTRAVRKTDISEAVDRYRNLMGHRHLDVGPGTGYFIEKAAPAAGTEITLMMRIRGYSRIARGDWRGCIQRRSKPTC